MRKTDRLIKKTLIGTSMFVFVLTAVSAGGVLNKTGMVSASKNRNKIHMVAGETVNYPVASEIEKVSSKKKCVIARKSDGCVSLYSFKKGKEIVTVETKKGKKKILALVSENPIKSEIVSLTKDTYGNEIAILKYINTDKEKTYKNVELAYSLMTKPIKGISKQAASGCEKVDLLRPGEYTYVTVAIDKNNAKARDIDKNKSDLFVSALEESEDTWLKVTKMVKIEHDVDKKVKKDFITPTFVIRNADENPTENMIDMVFRDKNKNVSQVESFSYPCSGQVAREYQSDVYLDSTISKTVEVQTQSFVLLEQ